MNLAEGNLCLLFILFSSPSSRSSPTLIFIRCAHHSLAPQIRKEDDESGVAKDWKYAAMVVDRLCLIIFTFFTIAATVAVLMSAPHIIVS
jgi:hypothetical protein